MSLQVVTSGTLVPFSGRPLYREAFQDYYPKLHPIVVQRLEHSVRTPHSTFTLLLRFFKYVACLLNK